MTENYNYRIFQRTNRGRIYSGKEASENNFAFLTFKSGLDSEPSWINGFDGDKTVDRDYFISPETLPQAEAFCQALCDALTLLEDEKITLQDYVNTLLKPVTGYRNKSVQIAMKEKYPSSIPAKKELAAIFTIKHPDGGTYAIIETPLPNLNRLDKAIDVAYMTTLQEQKKFGPKAEDHEYNL